MTDIAPAPRHAPSGWQSGHSLNLAFMMRSTPVRRLSASERTARLAHLRARAPRAKRQA
jgi:hypothetical protein